MRLLFALLILASIFTHAKTLTVGVMDSRPFFWKENGKSTGFHYEIAKLLSDKMKFQLVVKEAPILRIISMLKKGEVDVVIVTDHKELESLNVKKELVMELGSFLYTLDDQPITSKKEIRGRIARLNNACKALEGYKEVEWSEVESYEQAYGLLLRKRIRAVCGTIAFQIVAKKKSETKEAMIKSFLISQKGLWIQAMPKFDPDIWSEVQNHLKVIVSDGSVESAAKKFSK